MARYKTGKYYNHPRAMVQRTEEAEAMSLIDILSNVFIVIGVYVFSKWIAEVFVKRISKWSSLKDAISAD